jgi:hypothetical protein
MWITWGIWKMGAWGRNIVPKTIYVLIGICFRGLGCPSIETCVEPPVEM